MTLLLITIAMLVMAITQAVLTYQVVRLWRAVRWLVDHEQTHCGQIGELQRHVATVAVHLNNATATPLPRDVMEYATEMLDYLNG